MNKLLIILAVVAAAAAVCCASQLLSPVKQCNGKNFEGLEHRIKIDPCASNKCKLRRLTNVTVAFQFLPLKEVKTLRNNVSATLTAFPIPLPFIGTTGTSACEDVRFKETDEKAHCPLQPGIEYVYKNVFYVQPIYPVTDLVVHWSLDDGEDQVICFEVPATIAEAKSKKKVLSKA